MERVIECIHIQRDGVQTAVEEGSKKRNKSKKKRDPGKIHSEIGGIDALGD